MQKDEQRDVKCYMCPFLKVFEKVVSKLWMNKLNVCANGEKQWTY